MTDSKMPLTEHLVELRKRLFVSLTVIMAAFIACFTYSESIFKLLLMPMSTYPKITLAYPFVKYITKPDPPKLVFLAPAEAFWMHLKISFIAGVIISIPVIFYQIWKFISPGLLTKEKKYVTPFVLSGTVLFLAGASFCFLVVLPFALQFLLTYKTEYMTPMISIGHYMDFCLKFILAFGIVFEMPVVIVILTRMGIVSTQTLAKNRKYAVLLAFIIAAILTPTPDAFNQTLMALPIIVLYEVGILASRIFVRRAKPVAE
ncbi:MAG: twin-arginine translocase subunit TatC [Nitrospiraceae bacterium]|nr:twin-arginine translocase subunit TatC [Nitrospiraceae bacterium]